MFLWVCCSYVPMGVLFISCSECDEYNCDCLFSLSHRCVVHPMKGIGFSIDCKNLIFTFIDKM